MTIKVDMHVHTSCSRDSLLPVDDLLATCARNGIDCVAVTDHNTIECALKLHEIEPSKIIVGEEILTSAGEIIGLFLKKPVQPHLSPADTIDRIKEQGGLVYVPHPFDGIRAAPLGGKVLEKLWEKVDIIEIFNSRNTFVSSNWKSLNYASEKNIPFGVGSDAHTKFEVGRACVIIEPFDSASDFLLKLANANFQTRKTPVMFNVVNKVYKVARGAKRSG